MAQRNKDRNRNKKSARNPDKRPLKPLILVVAEGETEKMYIDTFANFYENRLVDVRCEGRAGTPKKIVAEAKKLKQQQEQRAQAEKDNSLNFNKVWCVFDIDDHPYVPDAVQMARDNGFELAISNPCFEIWLWLHFADQPGLQHRHDLQDMLEKYMPDYDKKVDFENLKDGYNAAVKRAERLGKEAEEEGEEAYKRNPTTGMWRLTEKIIKKKKKV